MSRESLHEKLLAAGVQPSAQRLAVAAHVLATRAHPTAEQVYAEVRSRIPMISRATVYNTLNLFVRRGLLRTVAASEGRVLFDPLVERHHHFVDDETGEVHDLPWDALDVRRVEALEGVTVREYEVVLHGRWRRRGRRRAARRAR
jgi:Fur family iron response transcriptional regulator